VSLVVILAGAGLFTNSIEWFGRKLKLGRAAVGSVLAAVGTALPETMIPIIAIIKGGEAAHEIGIGAILGAPLMLSTLAFFVTGLGIVVFARSGRRGIEVTADPTVVRRDLKWFFLVYSVSIGASFLPGMSYKIPVAVSLVFAYAWYVRATFRARSSSHHAEGELSALYFRRSVDDPPLPYVIAQVVVSLGIIIGGAHLFVQHIEHIAEELGISALVLSLIIAPIATELPEKFNSVIWVRQNKDTLAFGNISGAMVFQSSLPPAIGLLFTPWALTRQALAAGITALVAAGILSLEFLICKRISAYALMFGIVLYAAYLVCIFGIM